MRGGATKHRKNFPRLDSLDQSLRHFFLLDFLSFNIFFQQGIVNFSHTLNQSLPRFLNIVLHVFGNLFERNAVVLVAFLDADGHSQKIDNALESCFLADRQLNRHNPRTEAQAQFIDDILIICMFTVNLVHKEGTRQIHSFRITPNLLRLNLDA